MFFSIIVVAYNAGEKLHQTLESIFSQDMGDYEVIVKDAMSEDGSTEGLAEDSRVRLIREEDGGIYEGMNRAAGCSEGRILYFLNCGDVLHDTGVLSAVKAFIEKEDPEGKGNALYYGDVKEMQSGNVVRANPEMTDFALYRNIPCHQACFYTKDLFEERAFDSVYRVRADYEHFLYCHYVKRARMVSMNLTVADYEGGGYSESSSGREISAREHKEITERYLQGHKLFLYRLAMVLSLQPLREKLARGRLTGKWYNRAKSAAYGTKKT